MKSVIQMMILGLRLMMLTKIGRIIGPILITILFGGMLYSFGSGITIPESSQGELVDFMRQVVEECNQVADPKDQ